METFASLFARSRSGTSWSLRKLQGELTARHGINASYSYLGSLEKGRRVPSYDLATALAMILGINVKRALKAAYSSRLESDKRREENYIERTIRKRGLADLSVDEITGRKR